MTERTVDPERLRMLERELHRRKLECNMQERAMIYTALIFMANNMESGQEEQDGTREG